ncbi:CPBP family intramembrane glutamic endopeptidase [Leucobacter soli]|uniref:CPBP family intramembrane glutamic endopeptidase n=1 Tax=Leucobacter soli TaxID=2812850 RepID=UPI003619D2BE
MNERIDGNLSDQPDRGTGRTGRAGRTDRPERTAAPLSGGRPDRPDRVPWAAVIVYIVVAFGLAWLVAIPIWSSGGGEAPDLAAKIAVTGMAMMFTPTVAALAAMLVSRAPRGTRLRLLGLWPLRPAKRVVWFMVGAILAPIAVVVAVVFVSAALGLVRLDLVGFSGFREMLDAQLAGLDPAVAAAMPPIGLLVALQLLSIPFGALVNTVFALGEELGWRGWLLPALRPFGRWPALLITGVVWGLWHSPLILLGYNFGYTDWRGVALMVGGCVAWGVLFGWARLRSASVWPAAIGHGALNASAVLGRAD